MSLIQNFSTSLAICNAWFIGLEVSSFRESADKGIHYELEALYWCRIHVVVHAFKKSITSMEKLLQKK